MSPSDTRFVALLRGVNVGGNRKVPMAELKAIAAELRWTEVATYINSGNLVFTASAAPSTLAARLEAALLERFGFEVPVVVRSQAQWQVYAKGSPFLGAQRERPHLVQLGLSVKPPAPGAQKALDVAATQGERVKLVGDALWVDYPAGIARSKLTPAALDKAAGSTVTARNWKSVLALAELLSR